MKHLDNLDEIEGALVRIVRDEMANVRNADTRELAFIIDMIKDIAEAKKCTLEGCYYESRINDGEGMRFGYSRGGRGYNSNGRGGGYSSSERRGYSGRQDAMQEMRDILRSGDKVEKDRLREELQSMIDEA